MKLTWRDIAMTLLALAGGTIVYAKFYDYSWAVIGSWRSAVAVLAGISVLMFAFSRFNFSSRSIISEGEMVFGAIAIGLAVMGMIFTSQAIFYIFAAAMGVLWLAETVRHAYHSLTDEDTTTSFHHQAPIH